VPGNRRPEDQNVQNIRLPDYRGDDYWRPANRDRASSLCVGSVDRTHQQHKDAHRRDLHRPRSLRPLEYRLVDEWLPQPPQQPRGERRGRRRVWTRRPRRRSTHGAWTGGRTPNPEGSYALPVSTTSKGLIAITVASHPARPGRSCPTPSAPISEGFREVSGGFSAEADSRTIPCPAEANPLKRRAHELATPKARAAALEQVSPIPLL
jgi:hypothetical protein